MRKLLGGMLITLVTSSAHATSGKLNRPCRMFSQANRGAEVVCRLKRGAAIKVIDVLDTGFVQAKNEECEGYVPLTCVDISRATNRTGKSKRQVSSVEEGTPYNSFTRLGLGLYGDGLLATVPYSSTSSSGLGFGVGLPLRFPMGNNMHATIEPKFSILKISRTIDGTGALSDPSPVTFTQSLTYYGATLLTGYRFRGGDGGLMEWWLDGGFEILLPLSGSQESTVTTSTSYNPPDKILYALAGASATFKTSGKLGYTAGLQLLYNLAASGGSSVLGARLMVAVNLGL